MNKVSSVCFVLASILSIPGLAHAQDEFSQEDAKKLVQAYVDDHIRQDGSFHFKDQQADATLELEMDRIRLVRTIHTYGHFVSVDFHAKGDPTKPYDIDFWVKPEGGKLAVVDIRIHKAPKREGTEWKLVSRSPVPWWWIPASEHPGETEEKKGWQIESALDEYVAQNIKNGVLSLKDDKTGKDLTLEFVEIHRPMRKVEGQGYFACTDFKEAGSKDKFYDIDFWLTEKDGNLSVTKTRVHKEPKCEDGLCTEVSRYTFENDKVKDVP